MKRILGCLLLMSACLFAAAPKQPGLLANTVQPEDKSRQTSASDDGEKRFEANCGRCHNAPESLSPRDTRAVVRHMRVRARLTAEDEKLILQYLAP